MLFHVKRFNLCLALLLLCIVLFATNRMVAEWEPQRGTLVRFPFGIPQNLVVSLTEQDTLYILVTNNTAYDNALGALSAWGANLNHCRFIFAPTNSHWTRDWGPQSVFIENETFGIVDPIFSGYPWVPGREELDPRYSDDNAVNQILCDHFGVPRVPFSGYLTGGNVMYDGFGAAFSTAQMINENFPLMNSDEFLAHALNVLGVHNYHFTINPEFYGIQHIDCWAKLLDEETVLVKQLPISHPEYGRAENIAQQFSQTLTVWGKPYRVVRIFCGTYSGNNAAAYTNSYILNGRAYVPLFNIASDAAAIQTYQDAMPGYEVLGFPWTSWYHYDALHCRVMGIADGEMLRLTHTPPGDTTYVTDGTYVLTANIKSYGQFQLIAGELNCHYRIRPATQWQSTDLVQTLDPLRFQATISALENDQILEYYFAAADNSGRSASVPHNAPHKYFQTHLIAATSIPQQIVPLSKPLLYPNPAKGVLSLRWDNPPRTAHQLEIYNLKGQLLHQELLGAGKTHAMIELPMLASGVYFYSITDPDRSGFFIARGKVMLVK